MLLLAASGLSRKMKSKVVICVVLAMKFESANKCFVLLESPQKVKKNFNQSWLHTGRCTYVPQNTYVLRFTRQRSYQLVLVVEGLDSPRTE
jgi:hypothetical protein